MKDEIGRVKVEKGKDTENVVRSNLKKRTQDFALKAIQLYSLLPKKTETQILGKQLLRSGTSVGAHYREAQRSRSDAEFISKMEVGLQELEETSYWLELLVESGFGEQTKLCELLQEVNELTAIFVTCVKNAKRRIL